MAKDIEFNIIARDMASPVMEKVIQTSAKMQEALSEAGGKASESFKDVFKGKKAPPDKGSKENVKTKKKAAVRKEDEGIAGGFTPIPKWMATPLRAIGAYRMAWLSGKKMGGRDEETGERSKSGMAMGAAAGIYILQAMKDGVMKIVDILSTASPFLKAQLKILNIGFMQILKPFGDMVGMALKPLGKMMLAFSRQARISLREAGLTPKDKEYMSAYVNMATHAFYHMFTGSTGDSGAILPEGDFGDIAGRFAESMFKRTSKMSYLEYLGLDTASMDAELKKALTTWTETNKVEGTAEDILKKWLDQIGYDWEGIYGPGFSAEDLTGSVDSFLKWAEEQAEEKTGEDVMSIYDWTDLTQAEREGKVSLDALTVSTTTLNSTNIGLTGAIIGLTQALIQQYAQNGYSPPMGAATRSRNLIDLEKLSYSPVEGMYAQGIGKTAYTSEFIYGGRGGQNGRL